MNALLEGTTDRDLLNRFRKSKDREAFTEIVHRYGPAVFGICRRVLGTLTGRRMPFNRPS